MKVLGLGLTAFALSLGLIGCEEDDCTPTLEEWCGEPGCVERADLDDALASLRESDSMFDSAEQCGDRAIVHTSGGYVGSSRAYDVATGKLVGGVKFTDVVTDDECANQKMAAGEPTECEGETCSLLGNTYLQEQNEACEGELAEPFIEACLAEPPAQISACKECACPSCYPLLIPARKPGSQLVPAAVDCVSEHCAVECSAQLEAIE